MHTEFVSVLTRELCALVDELVPAEDLDGLEISWAEDPGSPRSHTRLSLTLHGSVQHFDLRGLEPAGDFLSPGTLATLRVEILDRLESLEVLESSRRPDRAATPPGVAGGPAVGTPGGATAGVSRDRHPHRSRGTAVRVLA